MGLLDSVVNTLTGGLGSQIVDTITKYLPPDLSPEQKANIDLAAQNIELQKARDGIQAQQEAEKLVNERIAMYEGTASDLKSVPYIGALMLLLRGSQRVAWGFGTLWLDFQVFSGTYKLTDPIISNSFWVVNFLVLGFLFGERAVTNVMPFITEMIKVKKG